MACHARRRLTVSSSPKAMMACHARRRSTVCCSKAVIACEQHTVERRRAWHAIIALGQHTRSNDVGRGMPSLPLGSTHGRTTSGVACHHSPWTANTVERCRAWHANIAFGQHRRSHDVGRGMPSSPLGRTHSRMTSGVACHHCLREAHTVERRWAWHAIIAFGKHTWTNNVRRCMQS